MPDSCRIIIYVVAIPVAFLAIVLACPFMWLFGIILYILVIPTTFILINIGTVLMWLFGYVAQPLCRVLRVLGSSAIHTLVARRD